MSQITQNFLDQLKPILTDRDVAIAGEVGRFKIMTAGQLERLFFHTYTDPTTGQSVPYSEASRSRGRQEVLRRLVTNRVLARVEGRRVGGAARGSAGYVYMLDVAGQYLTGLTSAQPRRPAIDYRPSREHALTIAELYVRLVEAQRGGALVELGFTTEPYCWRSFDDQTLKPDAFLQVAIERDGQRGRRSFFIEIDRGTQWGANIAGKIPQYLAYHEHEQLEVVRTGQRRRFPLVLFLAPNDARRDYLARLIERSGQDLFTVALFDRAIPLFAGS